MPRALPSLVIAVVALTVLSACSGDAEPATTPTPSVGAVASVDHTAELAALYVGNSAQPQDVSEGRCFARELQSRLDERDLLAAGIVGSDGAVADVLPVFDEVTATAWVDAQLACVGFIEASTRALLTQTRGELDAEAYAACLDATLSDEEIRAALVQTLSGGLASASVSALADAQSTCAEPPPR